MANTTVTSTHTVTLQPGERFVIPDGATILVVSDPDSLESDCIDIPLTTYKCWKFLWEDDDGDNAHNDTYFTGIKLGDTIYPLNGAPVAPPNSYDNGADYLAAALPIMVPTGLVTGIVSGGGVATNPKCLVIQIPDTYPQPMIIYSNPGFEEAAFLGQSDAGCDCS